MRENVNNIISLYYNHSTTNVNTLHTQSLSLSLLFFLPFSLPTSLPSPHLSILSLPFNNWHYCNLINNYGELKHYVEMFKQATKSKWLYSYELPCHARTQKHRKDKLDPISCRPIKCYTNK